ncbi:MAG: aminotransferase class I/II-fold pyridoxal phosphate-dependent enzyme [Thermoplasmata archaeon]
MSKTGVSVGYRFSARSGSVEESGIRKMLGMARPGAINLSIGEPNFEPPENVREALKRALDENRNNYGPSAGIPALRDAIAERLRRLWREVRRENIVVTVGATEALFAVAHILYERGDEVLVPDPGFVLYAAHAKMHGATPVPYPLKEENGYLPIDEELKELITPRTRAIVVNSPSNPTGRTLSADDVKAICDLSRDHDLAIISDEVYDELVFDGRHESFLGAGEKVIYINSFSKTYSTTGWRLGYVAADEEVAKRVERISYHLVACPPTITQYSALEALQPRTMEFVKAMVEEFRARRDLMVRGLNAIKGFRCISPEGGIYVFPAFSFNLSSHELAMRLVEGGVLTVPGSAFGKMGEGHLRICLGAKRAELEEGLRRIEAATAGLSRTH